MRARLTRAERRFNRHNKEQSHTMWMDIRDAQPDEYYDPVAFKIFQEEGWLDVESEDNLWEYRAAAYYLGIKDYNTREYMEAVTTAFEMFDDAPTIDPIIGRVAMIYTHGRACPREQPHPRQAKKGVMMMDLKAYVQIDDLSKIAEANGINVPRLRGYRLMRDEKPYTEEEIESLIKMEYDSTVRSMVHCLERMASAACEGDTRRYDCEKSWLEVEEKRFYESYDGKLKAQSEMYNKYCGRDDVLLIHARLGRSNWSGTTWKAFKDEPWFLEGIDDADDSTYCDMYAKVVLPAEGDDTPADDAQIGDGSTIHSDKP